MQFQFIQASRILQPFIKNYWILEADLASSKSCVQRIFPNGFSEMIFYYGDNYNKIDKDGRIRTQSLLGISGQKMDFYDVQPTGDIGLIAVTFKPEALKMFLNIPACEIGNISVSFEDIYGSKMKTLENRLKDSINNENRIKLIEEFLINQIDESCVNDCKRINYSIDFINKYKGIISVEKLADSACLSIRQFNRKFSEYVGLNPKQFTRVVRFQNAIYTHQIRAYKNYTDLAYICGYYDQAHFINEFKLFTGFTPKEFFNLGKIYSDYFS